MWCIEKVICIFNNILQKISSQKSFLWENENDHKKYHSPWVLRHCWLIWLWSHLFTHHIYMWNFYFKSNMLEIQIINWGFRINFELCIYIVFEEIFSPMEVIILQLWPNLRTKMISMFQFKPLDAISYPCNCDLLDFSTFPFMAWLWAMNSLCIDNMYNLFKNME
jgi:hypothetical protein